MKLRHIYFAIAILLLASCEKKELSPFPGRIHVKVTASDTKGTVTTTEGLKMTGSFSLVAYIAEDYVDPHDIADPDDDETKGPGLYIGSGSSGSITPVSVNMAAGQWGITGDPTWVAGTPTRFWAWHPVNTVGTRTISGPTDGTAPDYFDGEAISFTYALSPDGTDDADDTTVDDLLFAYTKQTYNEEADNSTINITFHHALSQVRFCVSTDDGTFDKSLKIKSISISNLATSGTGKFTDSGNAENNDYAYSPTNDSYDQFVWTNQTGSATFGQTYNADFSTSTVSGWTKGSYTKDSHTYNLYTCQNVFFMIPQTVTTTNMMTVVFDYKGVETTKSVQIADTDGDTWKGDHYYTYKIKATTVGRDIDLSVSLVGWTNRKDEIFI